MASQFRNIERLLSSSTKHSSDYISEVLSYSEHLHKQDLPIILSKEHLGLLIGKSPNRVIKIAKNSSFLYKSYSINKKSGGHRWITSPSNELKYIQTWIKIFILDKIDIFANSTGFVKGKSIKDNAAIHLNQELILNIDLYNFFNTITYHRIKGLFFSLGYTEDISELLSLLTTTNLPPLYWEQSKEDNIFSEQYVKWQPRVLPQGAPTSPVISNIILRKMDLRINGYCSKHDLKYSRYADDITISGDENKFESLNYFIRKIIREEGFYINEHKTRYLRPHQRQEVTGITVNDKISVNKKLKRDINTHLHFCLKYSPQNHLEYLQKKRGGEIKSNFHDWLLGNISFIYSIEPEVGKMMFDKFNRIVWNISFS